MAEIHNLLKRQIRKSFEDPSVISEECHNMLRLVDGAYKEFEDDHEMLERSLELSSQEMMQLTKQLQTVHQIALGIESRTNLEEIIEFVVESARTIPGIHFVMVQKLDETRQYVMTPYFSRLREDSKAHLLKKIGFDLNDYLGKHTTSNKFKLPLDRLPIAQDYLAKPRTIIVDDLAAMLNGIWPKPLCDAIQKIIEVKQFVITPLLIDGNSWGNILFFLTSHIPISILEMISTHCASGIKNSRMVQSLKDQNRELMALNRIAKKTTSTLQLQSLLENILAEIITIFDAYSADIFLSTKNQAQLELAAHAGEPLDNKSWAAPIILDQTVLEEIFAQNTDIITGDIQHFTNLLPHYASLDNKGKHLSCAAAIMRQPGRTGVLVIVPKEGQAFQAPERSLLITISGQVSLAIENSRLHSDLLSKIDEKELINDNLEEALKQLTDSEEKARQTIETVTDGIIVTDTEGEITDINHAGLKMCNLSRKEDILGLNVLQWLGGKHQDILKTTISQGETGINLSTTITNDKYQFEAELHAAAIRNKKGQAYGLVFSIRDVTEAKKAEAVLRESEEKYRTIFESANDIMILLDNKRNILDVNPRISDVGGYDREELIGKNFSSLTKILTKKSLLVITANYLKRLSGLNVPTYEVEMYKKNGEKATIEVNAKPVKRSGEIVGDLVVLRDVSERRKAVTQLMEQKALTDRILASSTNAVAVIGQDRRLKIANHTFELLFQLGKGTGEGLDIGLLTQVPELVEAISKVIAYGQSIIALEFRINYDITEYTMLADIVSMGNNEVLLTIRDITMTVERQERLYLTDRLASVGEMASGVAHELNNPLTSIIGLSQLLTEEKIPDNIRDDIGFISSEAQRASRVVKNLLTFARRHETERRPVNITQIVDDVLKLRAYENKVNNIEIQTIIPQDLPQIMADYFQIQQVFLNIILNAEQAMKESHGSGKLTISAEKTGNIIRISFIDNGPGIAKENMKRIFDPFFTTKEVGKGTGLGLSICYGIVTDHNGKILVESKCGKGTTFIVEFPVHNN